MNLRIKTLLALSVAMLLLGAARMGQLKLDVLGDLGAGAKNEARVIRSDGMEAARVRPGATVSLAPGTYKLVVPIVGGKIVKSKVTIEAGRVHTVLITNVAVLAVGTRDKEGKEPGFGVTVKTTAKPHRELARFLTGDKMLFAPAEVDVKVDAPPQGYYWHAVKLRPGHEARLNLREKKPAELWVQPVLSKIELDDETRVTVYRAGTQRAVAESRPGRAHRFRLKPGEYDVRVENSSGKGRPYVSLGGIRLDSGEKVERKVPLD